MTQRQILIDATMLLRWRHLAPVGIVRLERLLAEHLRFHSAIGVAHYIVWDGGYRPADEHEVASLDDLLRNGVRRSAQQADEPADAPPGTAAPRAPLPRRVLSGVRRTGLRAVGRLPAHLRPFAEQAAWSVATFGVESARHVKRARAERRELATPAPTNGVRHRVDFTADTDLIALGLGWEYLDHEAMYRLATERSVRIHMPAFDLIPVQMPQMNVWQSHLVHRYYAEMAHYADTITSISYATRDAIAGFYSAESLPVPYLAVNQLPGIESTSEQRGAREHRFSGEPFVLSVSTIEIRKNHLLLAKIWAECIREGRDMPKLVVVGRFGWDIEELQRWAGSAPELAENFVMAVDVEDDELVELYRDALFTVFPSRVEGWGLPITESLAYGKACVHSTDPAQFEASQQLMPALHPDDFLGWKAEILRLCDDAEYRSSLEARIADEYTPRRPEEYCRDYEAMLATRAGTN